MGLPGDIYGTDALGAPLPDPATLGLPVPGGGVDPFAVAPPEPATVWPPPEWGQPVDLGVAPLEAPMAPPPAAVPLKEAAAAAQPPAELAPPPEPYFDEDGFQRDIVQQVGQQVASDDPFGVQPEVPSFDSLAGDDALSAHEVERQVAMSPEERAIDSYMRESERERIYQDKAQEAADARANESAEAARVLTQANIATTKEMAELRTEADELAKARVDSAGVFGSASTGQKVAAYISVIASGLLNPRGPNGALQLIMSTIDREVDTQKANLAHQRALLGDRVNLVADSFARNQDIYRSGETARAAAYENAINMATVERDKYDPRGSRFAALTSFVMDFRQKQAEHLAAVEEATLKRNIERAKLAREGLRIMPDGVTVKDVGRGGGVKRYTPEQVRSIAEMGGTVDPRYMPLGVTLPTGAAATKTPKQRIEEAGANEAEGKLIVKDPITGVDLGQASTAVAATNANVALENFHSLERNVERMKVLRREIGTTPGNRFLRGAENDARVAEYEALAAKTANAIAKLDDPTSAIRDSERDAIIDARIPMFNTPLSEGPEAAAAKEKALRDDARAGVKRAMTAANVKNFDPGSYYDDRPEPEETKAKSAARAVNTYRPVQIPDDPTIHPKVRASFQEKYLLNDIQATAPIHELEQLARTGGERGSAAEQTQAQEFLKAIAADPQNSAAAAAHEALGRLGLVPVRTGGE